MKQSARFGGLERSANSRIRRAIRYSFTNSFESVIHIMKRKQFFSRRSLAIAGLLGAFAGSGAWAQSPGEEPLLSIVTPGFNSTQTGSTVSVRVHFGRNAIQSTFHAEIDGTNITNLFAPMGQCDEYAHCDLQTELPAAMLLSGTNIVTAVVNGPNESAAAGRTSFEFGGPSASSEPVSRMIPAVSVQSVYLPANADPNNINSYQILLGPGPGFPQRVYTAEGLNCSSGINSMQALVLTSQTLTPETKVGNGSGQACFGSSATLATFLQGLPKNDVVIMNSFKGKMSNLDTRAIGGSQYTRETPFYNAIGVVGGSAGSAYESYQPNDNFKDSHELNHLPPLVGSLMLDVDHRYFFAPSQYKEVKVTPGEMSEDQCASVEYGGSTYRNCNTSGGAGGFWIVSIDRLSGHVTDRYVLETNSNDAAKARQAISDLSYLLDNYYKSNDLLILTTFGTPIGVNAPVTASLYTAINNLGGNAFHLPQLKATGSSYLLISAPDQNYTSKHYQLESFETAGGPHYGPAHVLLSKNRTGQYVMNVGVQDQQQTNPFGFEWSEVLYQQAQNWPAWTVAQQKLYEDLTSSADHYPAVRQALGCANSPCQPIRSYYVGGIGTPGTTPAVLSIPYASLQCYPGSAEYQCSDDWVPVQKELAAEQGWARNVYTAYGQIMAITASSQDNLQMQLSDVASSIENSLYDNNPNSALTIQRLNQASAVAGLFSVLPGVGSAAGAVSATLNAAAAFIPVGATPIPEQYSFTLRQLRDRTATVSGDLQQGALAVFAAAVQDYGKLSTIGGAIGSQVAPFYMCLGCVDSKLPQASLPLFALGGKQSFYKALLPTAYSSDVFVEKKTDNPKSYGTYARLFDGYACYKPYGNAPTDTYWSFPSINLPATWDVFIVTRTATGNYPGTSIKTFTFPSQSLLNELFKAPDKTGTPPTYRLSGGAGLTHDDLMPIYGGYLNRRDGYLAPGSNNSQCPAS
jgi:hypothetical protein